MSDSKVKTVVIACMWCGLPESPDAVIVPCSGRAEPSAIFDAFRRGISGVLVLGCPVDDCHYKTGSRLAAGMVAEAKKLAQVYGIKPERIAFQAARRHTDDAARFRKEFEEGIAALGPLKTKLRESS